MRAALPASTSERSSFEILSECVLLFFPFIQLFPSFAIPATLVSLFPSSLLLALRRVCACWCVAGLEPRRPDAHPRKDKNVAGMPPGLPGLQWSGLHFWRSGAHVPSSAKNEAAVGSELSVYPCPTQSCRAGWFALSALAHVRHTYNTPSAYALVRQIYSVRLND